MKTQAKPNRADLLQIMLSNGLSRSDVARILDRKVVTVGQWLSISGKDMPDHMLQLLKFETGEDR